MGNVGDNIRVSGGNWNFKKKAAKNCDRHVKKSIPGYIEGHDLILDISNFFVKKNSFVYDLGCSTGTLTTKLYKHNSKKKYAKFIGVDVEKDMIKLAKKKRNKNTYFINKDLKDFKMKKCDLIVMYYTLQFIPPSYRQSILNRVYKALNWGGALIIYEKTRGSDARFQDILTTVYNEYKMKQGYSASDLISKTRSLKGVMEPFSTQGNLDLLKRSGFKDINTIQKYICFEGFLAIK